MDAASSSAPQFHNNNQQQQRQSAAIALINFAINPQHFVEEDYYDLDSILATTANVACIFEQQTPLELFPLIGQKAPGKIPERGYRTNMPAWMLSAGIDNICQPVVPTAYSTVNRDVISAGSTARKLEATRLVAKQRHFYTFGMFICSHLSTDQGRQIALTLLDAFTQRIGPIITRAVDITTKPRDLLDEAEKRIFWAVQRSERRQREWIRREHGHSQRRSTKRKFYGQQQRGNNNGGSAAVGH